MGETQLQRPAVWTIGLFLCVLISPVAALAEGIADVGVGEVTTPPSPVLVAEPATLRWTVEVPPTTEVIDISLHRAPHVELIDRSWSRSEEALTIEVTVLVARPGTYPIGAIEASLRSASGDAHLMRSPGTNVNVEASFVPDEDSEALLPPTPPLPLVLHPLVPLSGGFLLLMTTLGYLARRFHQRNASAPPEEVPDPIDPIQHLRETLARLLAESDRATDAPVEWHQELSDALRIYLAGTALPGAREQTTTEIAASLRATNALRPDHQSRLLQVLRATDRVKFGGLRPALDWSVRVAQDAEALFMRLESERAAELPPSSEPTPEEAR